MIIGSHHPLIINAKVFFRINKTTFAKDNMHNMSQMGLMHCLKKMQEQFEISKEVQGNKLIITLKGEKDDVEKLDRKMDAMHVLMEDCCCGGNDDKECC